MNNINLLLKNNKMMFAEALKEMFEHLDTKLLSVVASRKWNYPSFSFPALLISTYSIYSFTIVHIALVTNKT